MVVARASRHIPPTAQISPPGMSSAPLADPSGESTEERGGDGDDERTDGDGHPGAQDRVAPHPGEEQHVAEEHRAEPGGVDDHRRVGPAEVVGAEQRRGGSTGWGRGGSDRRTAPRSTEAGGEHDGEAGARPAGVLRLDDGVDDAGRCRWRARRCSTGSGIRPGLASRPSGSTARPRKKLTMPTGRLMKNAHRQLRLVTTSAPSGRAERTGDGADRAPDGHRDGHLLPGERLQHEGERGRHEDRRADGFEHLRADQHADGRRQAAQHRPDGEDDDADRGTSAAGRRGRPDGPPGSAARRTPACRR